jgi:hypothetical protein
MLKPCLDCGTPADSTRCHRCGDTFNRTRNRQQTLRRQTNGARPYDTGTYRTVAKLVRATATRCHICGNGPRTNDPWQADHLTPVFQGGGAGPLAPAHRSCNISRANKLRANNPNDIANPNSNRTPTPTPHHPTTTPPAASHPTRQQNKH